MAESKLTIKIASDVSDAVSGIKAVNKHLDDMSKASSGVKAKFAQVSSVLGGVSIALGMVGKAVSAVNGFFKENVQLYSIQEQAQTRLATTLKATNNDVGMSATELYNLASALQEVTIYGDEAFIGVEALFVSTGKIAKDVMPSAIEATLDMASALGENLKSATSIWGYLSSVETTRIALCWKRIDWLHWMRVIIQDVFDRNLKSN